MADVTDLTPAVRDALAWRRWQRRRARAPFEPAESFRWIRLWRRTNGEAFVPTDIGLAAYVPDPPLPLPGGDR